MEDNELPTHCEQGKYPSQQIFSFGDLKLYSNFDSGNLLNAEKVSDFEYNLWVANDCQGTQCEKQLSTWFYFAIEGYEPNVKYTFTIKNFNKQCKLLREG